jgi:hypothetical protein
MKVASRNLHYKYEGREVTNLRLGETTNSSRKHMPKHWRVSA